MVKVRWKISGNYQGPLKFFGASSTGCFDGISYYFVEGSSGLVSVHQVDYQTPECRRARRPWMCSHGLRPGLGLSHRFLRFLRVRTILTETVFSQGDGSWEMAVVLSCGESSKAFLCAGHLRKDAQVAPMQDMFWRAFSFFSRPQDFRL